MQIVLKYGKFNLELVWLTLNNISCIHKKNMKPKRALSLLLKVLDITQKEIKAQDYAALTYLNLSAVYSELRKHRKSIFFANKAIKVLTMEIEQLRLKEVNSDQETRLNSNKLINNKNEKLSNIDSDYETEMNNASPEKIINEEHTEEENRFIANKREKTSLLAIAYYNAGAQLEFERQYKEWIESFRMAISVLEKNFAPNYPLTLQFKRTLSKAIQKYQTHITWKGWNRTFTNLNEEFVSKRVSSAASRPTSAHTTKIRTSQPFQGRNKSPKIRKRPFTAHSKEPMQKRNLDDSLMNPFGSPGEDECLFSLEEQNKADANKNPPNMQKEESRNKGVMSIQEKPSENIRTATAWPEYGTNKKFKRPQSAKTAFMSSGKFRAKSNIQDYATLELGKIFNKNNETSIKENTKSNSRLSKPPLSSCNKFKKLTRPSLKSFNNYSSLANVYNSGIDPRSTLSSFKKVITLNNY